MASANDLPDAAQVLIVQTAAQLPHVKITDMLMEVDEWTGFTRHFTHLKTGDTAKDKKLLLTTMRADGISLGLTKMAESCPGTTYANLSWLQAWHLRDETYGAVLAELVNAQSRQPLAGNWGDGTTSSSDGQRFGAGGRAQSTGHINPKYGAEPGRMFYNHISDQYSPFSAKIVNVGVRDSTYVLRGLFYHESDLRIEEHYTDTNGFTDHVFGLMHLLGFRFAPRIRDLGETKLYIPKGDTTYDALKPLIGGTSMSKPSVPIGTRSCDLAAGHLHQARHSDLITDAAQARQLPPPKRPGHRLARTGPDRTDTLCPGLAPKRRTAPTGQCRIEQGRGTQCTCTRSIFQPPWRNPGPRI